MPALTREAIAAALRRLGLKAGDIVMVHSSLSSLGYVQGGADAVVDAFLDVLEAQGTLVVPTFTFSNNRKPDPVFDPASDPSEMGRISETVRTRPGVRRSRHLIHSVSALGKSAREITGNHGPSAFAADGPFWKLYELEARVLILGVPYLRSTFFHVVEQLVVVPYREWVDREARVRERDGAERPLPTRIFRPKSGFAGNDFNKFGSMLAERGLSRVGGVGNAVAAMFPAKAALEVAVEEYRRDPSLFVTTCESLTPLRHGVMVGEPANEKAVLDPELYEANPVP